MQHPLVLVIKDLWYFVTSELRQLLPSTRLNPLLPPHHPLPLIGMSDIERHITDVPAESVGRLKTAESPDANTSQVVGTQTQLQPSSTTTAEVVVTTLPPPSPTIQYVAVDEAMCFVTPQRDFDSVLERFHYGTAVLVTGYQGEYAKVFWSHHEGWLHKDFLTPLKADVWPTCRPNIVYEATDSIVQKIRLLIDDTFYAGALHLPLQAGEWVTYRLREQQRIIPWSVTHGRTPGDWQNLLKGTRGIHVGITPKTDSIMEWRGDDSIGRVAYIEKVTPDRTLTISVVGYEEPGFLEERVLPESEWREFRPVFIEVL
jgi:hypothetical protein